MNRLAGLLAGLVLAAAPVQCLGAATPRLSPVERERLRFRLERLFNEADLLIRNSAASRADVARQERDARELRMMERIPFREDLTALRRSLAESAASTGVRLERLRAGPPPPRPAPPPRELGTERARPFRLSPEQVAEELPLRLEVRGERASIERWIARWKDEILRLVEPAGEFPLERGKKGGWIVHARAYRFRPGLEFPRLRPPDPLTLLPSWARKDPAAFARLEPELWRLVQKTRAAVPRARTHYKNRRQFLLNDARLSFFLSKSVK